MLAMLFRTVRNDWLQCCGAVTGTVCAAWLGGAYFVGSGVCNLCRGLGPFCTVARTACILLLLSTLCSGSFSVAAAVTVARLAMDRNIREGASMAHWAHYD